MSLTEGLILAVVVILAFVFRGSEFSGWVIAIAVLGTILFICQAIAGQLNESWAGPVYIAGFLISIPVVAKLTKKSEPPPDSGPEDSVGK